MPATRALIVSLALFVLIFPGSARQLRAAERGQSFDCDVLMPNPLASTTLSARSKSQKLFVTPEGEFGADEGRRYASVFWLHAPVTISMPGAMDPSGPTRWFAWGLRRDPERAFYQLRRRRAGETDFVTGENAHGSMDWHDLSAAQADTPGPAQSLVLWDILWGSFNPATLVKDGSGKSMAEAGDWYVRDALRFDPRTATLVQALEPFYLPGSCDFPLNRPNLAQYCDAFASGFRAATLAAVNGNCKSVPYREPPDPP